MFLIMNQIVRSIKCYFVLEGGIINQELMFLCMLNHFLEFITNIKECLEESLRGGKKEHDTIRV